MTGESGTAPTSAGAVIRRARTGAGLTRAELAGLTGRPESQVSSWEDGSVEPTFAEVDAAVRATGSTLTSVLDGYEADPHDSALLDTTLALTVDQRMERLTAYVRFVHAGQKAMRAAR